MVAVKSCTWLRARPAERSCLYQAKRFTRSCSAPHLEPDLHRKSIADPIHIELYQEPDKPCKEVLIDAQTAAVQVVKDNAAVRCKVELVVEERVPVARHRLRGSAPEGGTMGHGSVKAFAGVRHVWRGLKAVAPL